MAKRKTKIEPKICEVCGEEFTIKDKQRPYKFKKQKCCSRSCNAKLISRNNKGKRAHNYNRKLRTCINCGLEELVSPAFSDRPYCSRECMADHYASGLMKKENHPNWQGGKIKRNCLICGTEFEFDKCELLRERKMNRMFCSQSCKAKFYSERERNPNWKGGITTINLLERNTPEYRLWRIEVLKRDNYTCQTCGSKEKLHCYHKKSFKNYKELRTDVDNGVVLCEVCHYALRSQLQRQKNNS